MKVERNTKILLLVKYKIEDKLLFIFNNYINNKMEDIVINNIINSNINDNIDNSFMDVTIDSYSEVDSHYSIERNKHHNILCNLFVKSILKKDSEKKDDEFINKKIYKRIFKVFCGFCIIIVSLIVCSICIIII